MTAKDLIYLETPESKRACELITDMPEPWSRFMDLVVAYIDSRSKADSRLPHDRRAALEKRMELDDIVRAFQHRRKFDLREIQDAHDADISGVLAWLNEGKDGG